jgi:hypothetical protein
MEAPTGVESPWRELGYLSGRHYTNVSNVRA